MTMITTERDIKQEILQVFTNLKSAYDQNPVTSLAERLSGLNKLEHNLLAYRKKIQEALWLDFKKPKYETDTSEILTVLIELRKAKRELHRWMKPKTISTPTELLGTRHYIRMEPKGVVLILSPWNYPINLTLIPLIAAWSAGNRIMIKPSEFTPHTITVLQELIQDTFSDREVVLVNGDADIAKELVQLPFNHILFTGSATTAKKIIKASAEHLVPLTLELGGKTPVLIDETVSIKSIIKDIVFAKCLNAGQTCIAPDFIVLPENKKTEFTDEWKKAVTEMYGDNMLSNPEYCGIIHKGHYSKLLTIVQDSLDQGAALIEPLTIDPSTLKIKPIVLINSDWHHVSMDEELFGPVLPVISYKQFDELLLKLKDYNRQLSLYIFSHDKKRIEHVLNNLRSGGVTINNCLLHYCNFNMPFGGDQLSGYGAHHGQYGFETFSHKRPVSIQGKFLNPLRFFSPPYTLSKQRIKNIALKLLGKI